MRVLFVCHGNINRSAAAEVILKQLKPEWEVKSAGVKKNCAGKITAKKMREALCFAGYVTEGIRSSQCTKELCDWANIIFYMDRGNESRLRDLLGITWYYLNTHNLGHAIGSNKIADPAFAKGTEAHKAVVRDIEKAVKSWITELEKTE